ncbi:MAG: DUF3987 domain-containing protein [Dysgonamonadaceae bacterium]|nr:DUF3987 domain-containing protein [Dysgonamonadaceae bacterium]
MKNIGICLKDIPKNEEKVKVNESIFPIHLLPDWLRETIVEHSESYHTPKELWAIAFLAGIASATGKRVYLNHDNYINYPQLWIMVVGASGTGKSEAFRVSFKKLLDIDSKNFLDYQTEFQEWEQEKQGTAPHWKQTVIGDTTPEALFSSLSYTENGLTLYRDELSGWFADFGRYNKSGEVGHYLSIFDNQVLTINRKKEQPQLITEPFLNICGTIQPIVLSSLLEKNNFEESGFAQRFLFLYPEFPIRKYQKSTKKPSTEIYDKIIETLNENKGKDELVLSEESENLYETFYNEMEEQRSKTNDFWASVYAKAKIQVLRLALTVKVARMIDEPDNQVSVTDMQAGIEMMRYFIASLEKFKKEDNTVSKKSMIQNIINENPNVTQTDVAKMLGVTQQYISKVVGCKL